jgi:hypothetical protein
VERFELRIKHGWNVVERFELRIKRCGATTVLESSAAYFDPS